MSELTGMAFAKLNLTLDITGKLENGYHTISSVMQTIALGDTVTVAENSIGKIQIKTNMRFLPVDSNNLCHKAAMKFYEDMGIKGEGIDITIHKRIPVAAGMAGGSADAAAVLNLMEKIYGKPKDIMALASKIGADVPFCMKGGTALCEGIGDIITPIERSKRSVWLVIAKNSRKVSTANVYSCYDQKKDMVKVRPNNAEVIEALKNGQLKKLSEGLCNVFEPVLYQPPVDRLKKQILCHGAVGVSMTGAGPAVFGIFYDKVSAEKCAKALLEEDMYARVTKFLNP